MGMIRRLFVRASCTVCGRPYLFCICARLRGPR